jgi:hypothetical protein
MSKLKNKPKAGMKLHKVIALGGKPSDFKKLNKKK